MKTRAEGQLEAVRKIVSDFTLRAQLWLVKNGVPFDVAFALDATELEGWCIIFAEHEGSEYDFGTDSWKEPANG